MTAFTSDIEIARNARLTPITELAGRICIPQHPNDLLGCVLFRLISNLLVKSSDLAGF